MVKAKPFAGERVFGGTKAHLPYSLFSNPFSLIPITYYLILITYSLFPRFLALTHCLIQDLRTIPGIERKKFRELALAKRECVSPVIVAFMHSPLPHCRILHSLVPSASYLVPHFIDLSRDLRHYNVRCITRSCNVMYK